MVPLEIKRCSMIDPLLLLTLDVGVPGEVMNEFLRRALIERFAAVECCHLCHILVRKLEVEDVDVVGDARRCLGAGDYDVALLDVPAHDDLRRGLAVLVCELADDRLIEDRRVVATAQGIPRVQRDVVPRQKLLELGLREVRMALHLDERWSNFAMGEHVFGLGLIEVGDADGAKLARLVGGLELGVTDKVVARGLVRDHKVDVVVAQAVECLVHSAPFRAGRWA